MNWLLIEGHLGSDAEIRTTQSGKQVVGFSIGCSVGWGERKDTVWFRGSFWGDRAVKVAPYLTKGTHILATSEIEQEPRVWTDKGGTARAGIDVTVRDVRLLGGGGQREEQGPPTSLQDTEDIPW